METVYKMLVSYFQLIFISFFQQQKKQTYFISSSK